jgi:hypothetical protein
VASAETAGTELYDPATGSWSRVGDMNNRHADFFSVVLAAGGCGFAACPGFITPSAGSTIR